jgi:hypothetical protein
MIEKIYSLRKIHLTIFSINQCTGTFENYQMYHIIFLCYNIRIETTIEICKKKMKNRNYN